MKEHKKKVCFSFKMEKMINKSQLDYKYKLKSFGHLKFNLLKKMTGEHINGNRINRDDDGTYIKQ